MAILANANEILIDSDGNIAYLTDDKLYVYDADDTEVVGGYIKHIETDLGEPSVDKHLNGIDIDYKGTVTVYIYVDGVNEHTFSLPNRATRGTAWVHYPLAGRVPFQKFYTHFVTATAGTTIYGFEIDFNVTQRRRAG